MYCCFHEELHRSFTEMTCVRKKTSSVLGANDHLYIEDQVFTERTVSFVLIGHIDTLKVQS